MVEYVIEKMEKTIRQSQRALDGEFGIVDGMESQTIIWFQERVKLWVEMLKDYQSSNQTSNEAV